MIASEKRCHHTVSHQHGSGTSLIARSGQSSDAWLLVQWYWLYVRGRSIAGTEDLITVMQGEVLSTRSAAAQAEQRATDAETRVLGVRGKGVVDSQLLEKQKSFDGAMDNWRQFKFTFLAYAGAVELILNQAMIESEVLQEAAITNAALPPRDQRVSTQLYFMLVLLLEGSALAGTRRRW